MKIIADLHIHSKYSRACSKDLDLQNLEKWAKIKGINLLGTGDFTHPKWIKELKDNLTETKKCSGVYLTKGGFPFILQSELSLVYTQHKKGRRVHLIIFAPSFDVVDKITEEMLKIGRVDYDGRPIFKISCMDFVKLMKSISEKIEIIPAHIWTPWFGVLGSKGGFDTIEKAFGDQAKHIHALETGLSSDPEMNWRLTDLDNYNLVSFSDTHSFWPWRLGREATVMNLKELTYDNIIEALHNKKKITNNKDVNEILSTIEVDPGYGKYHLDGHKKCNICFIPRTTRRYNGICPVCKKKLTIGVEYRVEELQNRIDTTSNRPINARPFHRIIPLHDLIALKIGQGVDTKAVWEEYDKMIKHGGNEFNILLKANENELLMCTSKDIVELILKNREGKIMVMPGYDGEYGVPILNEEGHETIIDKIPKNVKDRMKEVQNDLEKFM